MLLLGVVALVEDEQLEGRQLDESVPQDVQQDLRRADDAVAVLELVLPGLVVEPVAAVLAARALPKLSELARHSHVTLHITSVNVYVLLKTPDLSPACPQSGVGR